MRIAAVAVLALVSCSRGATTTPPAPAEAAPQAAQTQSPDEPVSQPLAADTPMKTSAGHSFVAPMHWTVTVRGRASIISAPEGGSHIAMVDVQGKDAAAAVEAAWLTYGRPESPPLLVSERDGDRDGWTDIERFDYPTPPSQNRWLYAEVRRAQAGWLVMLVDMSNAVAEKRYAQVMLMYDQRFPKGYTPESFAGKTANRLDDARIAELGAFVETARTQLGVPGVSLGIVQDGEVVFVGGFGVRQLGKPARIDGDTKFMVASNTKALTTLMLAKLVDEGRMTWDSPATSLLSSFALGDAETTAKVQVKHLVCACTGLPRQDYEWLLEFGNTTPKKALAQLATMQPTSDFGALFQYSNPLAGAAGFLGGHVAFPKLALDKAYEETMRTRVFEPLGMKNTTLDHAGAQRGNWARPHGPTIDGDVAPALHAANDSSASWPAAGAVWSTARDLLAYVQMELSNGLLASGDRYIAQEALLARRTPQVVSGNQATYGMGLEVETKYGVPLVHHGGDMIGYHSDMMWLPDHGVGAVILTNGDPGWTIRDVFKRKLLEVLFDGTPRADAEIAATVASTAARIAAERTRFEVPADAAVVAKLAPAYGSDTLGDITVRRTKASTVFDFGEWASEVASRTRPDGTVSLTTIAPGIERIELVVGKDAGGKRTLTLRDYQHEYVFVEG